MVDFWMPVHPSVPRVTPLPQYSHVMTISPNLGEIGAPQLGHFREVAPVGAMTGAFGAAWVCGDCGDPLRLVPHFMQKAAPSGFWLPQCGQNNRDRL
jgi:hypothetical protein